MMPSTRQKHSPAANGQEPAISSLADLIPDPANARRHNPRARKHHGANE
jgi:hypothetical protein